MKKKSYKIFSVVVLLSMLLGMVGAVSAQAPNPETPAPAPNERVTFGIKPVDPMKSWFTFSAAPGEEIKDTVLLINETKSREIGVDLNAYDGRTIQTTGGSSFYADEPGTGVASWITLDKTGDYRVPAEKGVSVPFTVKVPEGTKTGEYFAMLMVRLTDPAPGEENVAASGSGNTSSSFAINIIRQSAVAVVIRVKGQEEFSYGVNVTNCSVQSRNDSMSILMHTVNTGNEGWAKSETGKISFKIRKAEEQATYLENYVFDKKMGYLGFGHELDYPFRLDVPLDAGNYAADIVMSMNEKLDSRTYTFTCNFTVTEEEANKVKPTPTPSPTLKPGEIPTPPPMTITYFFQSNPLILVLIIVVLLIFIVVIIFLAAALRRKKAEEDDDEYE